jgi:hypothetical protein
MSEGPETAKGIGEHLRGRVEAANFKICIFPLPFFKRICAVHQAATVL